MPIKYIGVPSQYFGNHLLWILSNLRNFGVGRMVQRLTHDHFPEPCFFIIKRVRPQMDEKNIWGDVWVEQWFRGRKLDEERLLDYSYLADYRLVPKNMEKELYDAAAALPPLKQRALPATRSFAPMLREVVVRDMKQRGINVSTEPKLKVFYREGLLPTYKVVDEAEAEINFNEPPELKERFMQGVQPIDVKVQESTSGA